MKVRSNAKYYAALNLVNCRRLKCLNRSIVFTAIYIYEIYIYFYTAIQTFKSISFQDACSKTLFIL